MKRQLLKTGFSPYPIDGPQDVEELPAHRSVRLERQVPKFPNETFRSPVPGKLYEVGLEREVIGPVKSSQ